MPESLAMTSHLNRKQSNVEGVSSIPENLQSKNFSRDSSNDQQIKVLFSKQKNSMNLNNVNQHVRRNNNQVYKSLNNLQLIDTKRNTMPIRRDNDQIEDKQNQIEQMTAHMQQVDSIVQTGYTTINSTDEYTDNDQDQRELNSQPNPMLSQTDHP